MILENDRYEVLPTWDYQQSAYEIYIKNKYTSKIEFFAPHDKTIKFTLERFDSAKNGLKGLQRFSSNDYWIQPKTLSFQ